MGYDGEIWPEGSFAKNKSRTVINFGLKTGLGFHQRTWKK